MTARIQPRSSINVSIAAAIQHPRHSQASNLRWAEAPKIAIAATARAMAPLTLGGDGVLQLQENKQHKPYRQQATGEVLAAGQSGVLEIGWSAPCARAAAALTAVAISSSSYLVALHTMARRPAAGAAAARMLAVDCFMVRAIVAGLGVRRVGRCLAEAKVEVGGRARPIECLEMQQSTRVLPKP